MKKATLTLGWILAIVAVILLAIIIFLSYYFLNLGTDIIKPIAYSLGVGCVVIALIIVLCKLKGCKNRSRFRLCGIFELVTLVAVAGTFILSIALGDHFTTVVGDNRVIVKKQVDYEISQVSQLFSNFNQHVINRCYAYEMQLESIEKSKSTNYKAYQDAGLANNSISTLTTKFADEIGGDCKTYEQQSKKWEKEVKAAASHWTLFQLMHEIPKIQSEISKIKVNLDAYDEIRPEVNELSTFWPMEINCDKNISQYFTKKSEKIHFVTIAGVFLLYLLLFLPYVAQQRSALSKGLFRSIFESGKKYEPDFIDYL